MHADKQLVNGTYPDKFRRDVEKKLRSRSIDVLLNTRVENIPINGTNEPVKSVDGKVIEADLVVSRTPLPSHSSNTTLPHLRSQPAAVAQLHPSFPPSPPTHSTAPVT